MPRKQRSERDVAVLVTGVGSGSTGEQVYKALRHGRRRYRLAVANVDLEQAAVAPDAKRVVLPPAGHDEYIDALAAAANALEVQFIIPGSDPELWRVAEQRAALAALTPAAPLVNDASAISVCSDKGATADAVCRAGCTAPGTVDCDDLGLAVRAMEESALRYPVVLKPQHGGGGSANVYLAQSEAELRFFGAYVLGQGVPLLLQEYVGDPQSEFTVGVLHYPDGALAGSFALRRELTSLLSTRLRVPNRTGRRELGPSLAVSSGFTQGATGDFPEVREAAEAVAQALGSTGPLNVQGRWVDGQLYVFEVNPRFSGTEAMRAMAGWNAPEALIDWHLGLPSGLDDYRPRCLRFIRGLAEYTVFQGGGRAS